MYDKPPQCITPYAEQLTVCWMSCVSVCAHTHLASGEGRSLEASSDETRPLLHPHHFDRDFQSLNILL